MKRKNDNNRKEYSRDEKIRYFIRRAKYALERVDVLYREEKLHNDVKIESNKRKKAA